MVVVEDMTVEYTQSYENDLMVELYLRPPPPQRSIFAKESPNRLKFSGYVGTIAGSLR